MTISILGCGWLGLPLAAHLAGRGHRVKGATTTPEKLGRIAAAGGAPYLIRLGAGGGVPEAARDFFEADALFLNVPPGRRTPGAASAYGAVVEQVVAAVDAAATPFVVFASSTSVYPDPGRAVTEADAPDPESESGRALWAAERRLQAAPGFAITVVRFAGLYGYDRQPGRFLAGRRGLAGADAPVNLIHRDDCVAIVTAILERDVRGEVFNACADEHPPRGRFYPRAALRLGLEPPGFDDAPAPFKRVSSEHLKRRLGYRFLHPDPMQDAP